MSSSLGLAPEIVSYLASVNPAEHPALKKCRTETAQLGGVARMQISPEQGAFMQVLTHLTRAERAFEIGVFTGYSSLAVALAMKEMHGEDCYLLACDISEEWTARARTYWREAEVSEIVDLQIGPATKTLDAWLENDEAGSYDLGFIDADKTGYDDYYERGLELLRPGGLLLFDNVLWGGAVADPTDKTPDTAALRALASKVQVDDRVHAAMVGVGDGVLMCVKK